MTFGAKVWKLVLLLALVSAVSQSQVVLTGNSFTSSTAPKTNFSSSIALVVGQGSNTYLQFSFAGLPSGLNGSNVSAANVLVFVDAVLTSGKMDVYAVNGTWSASTIDYNNAPALGSKILSAVPLSTTGYVSLNVTSTVQAWLNGTLANNGIALVPTSGSSILASIDSINNILTSHPPQLNLVLASTGAQGPPGPPGPTGATGATGPQGPQGPAGTNGATGPQGPQGLAGTNGVGFNFRSAFNSNTSYAANDVVSYDGSSYVATAPNQGPNNPTPDQNSAWSLMAQAGAPGAQGATGPQGSIGATGPQGATGTQGPAGPAGPQGVPGVMGLTGATGPQGPQGVQGPAGPPGQVTEAEFLALVARVAVLESAQGITPPPPPPPPPPVQENGRLDITVGGSPQSVAFDGTNIWVANYSGSVTELRETDGTTLATFPVSGTPVAITSAAQKIWVASWGDVNGATPGNITAFSSAGQDLGPSLLSTEPSGGLPMEPIALASDGTNTYFADLNSIAFRAITTPDGPPVAIGSIGLGVTAMLYDGTHLWASFGTNKVEEVNTSSGGPIISAAVGNNPVALAFDGVNIWVANNSDGTVTKLRESDGANLGTFAAGPSPSGIAFDGANIWVTNSTANTVTVLSAADGSGVATYNTPAGPYGIVFDGSHMWVGTISGIVSRF
jgi:hypothetical protein